jgi:hypothetical protein
MCPPKFRDGNILLALFFSSLAHILRTFGFAVHSPSDGIYTYIYKYRFLRALLPFIILLLASFSRSTQSIRFDNIGQSEEGPKNRNGGAKDDDTPVNATDRK